MKVKHSGKMAPALLFLAMLSFLATTLSLPSEPALAAQQEERPLLMIVVGFEGSGGKDAAAYSNDYDWNESLFSGDMSLAAYYRDQSQGLFSLVPAHETSAYGKNQNTNRPDSADDGIVHVNLDSARRAWGLASEDASEKDDFTRVVIDAFDAARAFVDFKAYDADGDGRISSDELTVIVCTAGYDASVIEDAKKSSLPLLWPHSGTIEDGFIDSSGNGDTLPDAYIAIAENFLREGERIADAQQEPIGVIARELGHQLGLPYLYTQSDAEEGVWSSYQVGPLSLMASGAWAQLPDNQQGPEFRPTSLDPWSLTKLGWSAPITAKTQGDYHLYSRNSSAGYNTLLIPTADSDQYFLLENRQPEGWDAALETVSKDGGIVIWHVDASVFGRFGSDGWVNDTSHRPSIMPVFFEKDESGAFSFDWLTTDPDLEEPFYSTISITRNFGDTSASIKPPLYAKNDDVDNPLNRTNSGVSIQVLSEPGEDMLVHVELTGNAEEAALSSERKPPLTLIFVVIALCIVAASVFALYETRRYYQRM